MSDERVWDEKLARMLIGKTLLVGLTYIDPAGDRVEQLHGEVVSADRGRGVELRLAGQRLGETFLLPPDLSNVFGGGARRVHAAGGLAKSLRIPISPRHGTSTRQGMTRRDYPRAPHHLPVEKSMMTCARNTGRNFVGLPAGRVADRPDSCFRLVRRLRRERYSRRVTRLRI